MYRDMLDRLRDQVLDMGEYEDMLDAIASVINTTAETIAENRDLDYNMVLMVLNEMFIADRYSEEEIIIELRDAGSI